MAGFLYYLPGVQQMSADAIVDAGLGPILGVGPMQVEESGTEKGPDGGRGCVVTAHPGALGVRAKTGYYPTAQRWQKCAGGRYWMGRDLGSTKPQPADLERPEVHSGYEATLSDGHKWVCPPTTALPSYFGYDDSGSDVRVRKMKPEFKGLSASADIAFRHFSREDWAFDAAWLATEEAADICIEALAVNYRVGAREAAELAMPTFQDAVSILGALLDLPALAGSAATEEKKSV